MNKLFFIILIILVSGCGFKIVNLSETNDFSIIDVNTNGDKKINYIIKNSILYASKSNKAKQITINISTKKDKIIKEKNIKNEITKYEITIIVDVIFSEITEKNSYNFTVIKNNSYDVASQNSVTRNNEKKLVSVLSNDLADDILKEIRLKLNDI
jgi:outer membrane lipopolysaccharide assembly protein LptE/RlpB